MVYDQYPGDSNQYNKGTPQEYPYPSQYFSAYNDGEIIGQSSDKDQKASLIVTSGKLVCDTYQNVKQGFTNTYNFRVLLNGMSADEVKVGWNASIMNAVVTPVAKHSNMPSWAGLHLFSRYLTSDDLYVASYRFDGLITIKKKISGIYTTLAQVDFGAPQLGTTYKLQFTTNGSTLSFYIDGKKVLYTDDSSLTWGTTGLRTDYIDCYVESLRMTTPKTVQTPPSPPPSTEDVFGITKLYTDKSGGPQWNALHWASGGPRTLSSGDYDPKDPSGISQCRGNSYMTIDGQGIMSFIGSDDVSTTEPRIYLNKPSTHFFKNVECTLYAMRINDDDTNWGGIVLGTRSGPDGHTSSDPCSAHTYYGRIRHDGKADLEKELKHPDSSVRESHNVWDGDRMPSDKWIGYKFCCYNVGSDVKLELYRDMTNGENGGTWVKLAGTLDAGDWSPPQSGTACSYPRNFIPLDGGGVVLLRNTGIKESLYKWMTVREINV